jgi:hypothetical protein
MRVVIALLLTAGVVLANTPPPPPRDVPIEATVKLDQEVKGFVLFFDDTSGELPKRAELSTDKPTALPFRVANGHQQSVYLLAVPEELVAKLKTVEDWNAARERKNSPIHYYGASGTALLNFTDDRKVVKQAFVIKGVDPKKGILVEDVKVDIIPEKKDVPKKPLAFAEPGYLIGGVAAAVSITLGGLWLVRRRK